MHCPTLDEVTSALLALLPRGRAWQTNEGLPRAGQEAAFSPSAFNDAAFSTQSTPSSVLYQFWRSVAVIVHFVTQRFCDLRLEFWCQTVSETRDEWLKEYGLPDECDPFPDLCTKVAAIGGTRCEYYAAIAARSGWAIDCRELTVFCGSRAGAGKSLAGRAKAGGTIGQSELIIDVFIQSSPAFQQRGRYLPAIAGRMRAGRRLSCVPTLTPLICVLSRVVHAEIHTIYEVKNVA